MDAKGHFIAPKDPSPLYVVIFADFTPDNIAKGHKLIERIRPRHQERSRQRSEANFWRKVTIPDHFMIQQVWQNTAAFKKHEEAEHTKEFAAPRPSPP